MRITAMGRITCKPSHSRVLGRLFYTLFIFISIVNAENVLSEDEYVENGVGEYPNSGLQPRRLFISSILKKIFMTELPQTSFLGRDMDAVVFIAGKNKADLSSTILTTMEIVMITFFRKFVGQSNHFPLQWVNVGEALGRSHKSAQEYVDKSYNELYDKYKEDPDSEPPAPVYVDDFARDSGHYARLNDWFFDGNTFHQRGSKKVKDKLTDMELTFLRGMPYNVVRLANGIFGEDVSPSVAAFEEELEVRGIKSYTSFLLKTNFIDLLLALDVFDETFSQIDVLREFIRNYESFQKGELLPPYIPIATAQRDHLEEIQKLRAPQQQYPKCKTLVCYMRMQWKEYAKHKHEKEQEERRKQKQQEEKKKTGKEPITFADLNVEKRNVNSLKLVVVGNTKDAEYSDKTGFWNKLKHGFRFNELERTVESLRKNHATEKYDIALGVGDFLKYPGSFTVDDKKFDSKWHDVFVKKAGLDIPWYMVLGDAESLINPSTAIRYHYSRQRVNYYLPDSTYKVTVNFSANLTKTDGGIEEQKFSADIIGIDTWQLLDGNPMLVNAFRYDQTMHQISQALALSAHNKTDWIIVVGHHPLVSTGRSGENGRAQFLEDLMKHGRARGPEHNLVQMLTFYEVDAYVSGHDYLMEFINMTNVDANATTSFITGGSASRLLDDSLIGRGWTGKLRGKMFPVLCWAGKNIFFKLSPGGCKPSEKDQAVAWKFFAPQNGNWKVQLKERITDTTGYASIKLTKDFLITNFINGQTGNIVGRTHHRQNNKAAREVRFSDPQEQGKVKFKELLQDHAAFIEENEELVACEVAFQTATPVLAQRVRLYETEINKLVKHYTDLSGMKKMYETMPAQQLAAMQQAGSEQSIVQDDLSVMVENIIEFMYAASKEHQYFMERYEVLKKLRKKLPKKDSKYAEAMLKLEKMYGDILAQKQKLTGEICNGKELTAKGEEELRNFILRLQVIRRDIAELDKAMQKESEAEGTEQVQKEEGNKSDEGKADKTKGKDDKDKNDLEVKPLSYSAEARLERKKKVLEEHEEVMKTFSELSAADKSDLNEEYAILKRQHNKLLDDIRRLETLIERKHNAADRRPSELWERRLAKHDLERSLGYLDAYRQSIIDKPKVHRRTGGMRDAVVNVEMQILEYQEEIGRVNEELYGTEPTELQLEYLKKLDLLKDVELMVQSENTLPEETLADPLIKQQLEECKQNLRIIQAEVEKVEDKLREELSLSDEAWVTRMILSGKDMSELAEEFSIDQDALIRQRETEIKEREEREAAAREKDPKLMLAYLESEVNKHNAWLKKYSELSEELKEKYFEQSENVEKRRAELVEKLELTRAHVEDPENNPNPIQMAIEKAREEAKCKEESSRSLVQQAQEADESLAERVSRKNERNEEILTLNREIKACEKNLQRLYKMSDRLNDFSVDPREDLKDKSEEVTEIVGKLEEAISSLRRRAQALEAINEHLMPASTEVEVADINGVNILKKLSHDLIKSLNILINSQDKLQDESIVNNNDETKLTPGIESRKLAGIMAWFEPARYESAVKELKKLELGPNDPCEGIPMLYVVVRKQIDNGYSSGFQEKCTKYFTNQANRAQSKYFMVLMDGGAPGGANTIYYKDPHDNVVDGLKAYFGNLKMGSLHKILRNMHEGLKYINEKIHVNKFDEAMEILNKNNETGLEQVDIEEHEVGGDDLDDIE